MADTARKWELRYSRKLVWTDSAAIFISILGGLCIAISFATRAPDNHPYFPDNYWIISFSIAVVYACTWLMALSLYNTRQPSVFGTGAEEYNRVASATLMTFGLITLLFYAVNTPVQRSFLFFAIPVGLVLMLAGRLLWRKRLHRQRRRGKNTYRTLLVGERRKSVHTANQLFRNTLAGFELVGAVTLESATRELMPGIPVVADYDNLLTAIEKLDVDTLIITSSDTLTPEWIRRLGWELENRHVDMILASALTDVAGPRIHTRPVAGLPLIHVEYPQFRGWRYFAKRMLDLFGALVGLILVSPLLLLLMLLVRMDSPGPAVFKQQRLGLRGRPFTMYKLRSMRLNAEEEFPGLLDRTDGNTVLFKMHDDPRVTRIGHFMRRYSLDELPQLVNVLKGDMSLVGPRPPLQHEVDKYEDWVNRRLFVRPGVSGLWQVSGRSNLPWDESVRIDLYYVENWSMVGDLLILWRTIRTVLRGDGAY